MPYINFDKKTLQIISISENRGDIDFVEISNDLFEKIINGEVSDFRIRKHPRKEVYVFTAAEFFNWFRWMNHDCEVNELGILINAKVTKGVRFVLSKRGNGNLIYKIVDVTEDSETFFIDYESSSLEELDVFMSAEKL